MAVSVKSLPRPSETADPYEALLGGITSEPQRVQARRSIERIVSRYIELAERLAEHDVLVREIEAICDAQKELPLYSLERVAFDQRYDQLDREATRVERRMALLEHLLEAAS